MDSYVREKMVEELFLEEYDKVSMEISLRLGRMSEKRYQGVITYDFLQQHFPQSLEHYYQCDFERIFIKYVCKNYTAMLTDDTHKEFDIFVNRLPPEDRNTVQTGYVFMINHHVKSRCVIH